MLDYISWYVIELRSRLMPHLRADRVTELTKEAESHLKEATHDLKERFQLSDDEAAQAAIDAFGKPEPIALAYLRTSNPRLLGLKPIWLVIGTTLITVFCFDYPWITMQGPFDNFGESWPRSAAFLVGMAALAIFIVAIARGYRSFRWQILGTCTAVCLILPPLLFTWMISGPDGQQGVSRFHLTRDEAKMHESILKLDSLAVYYTKAKAAFTKANQPSDLPLAFRDPAAAATRLGYVDNGEYSLNDGSHYPLLPATSGEHYPLPRGGIAMVDGRIWGLGNTGVPLDMTPLPADPKERQAFEFAVAKRNWVNQSSNSLKLLRSQQADLVNLLALVQEARAGRIFFPNSSLLLSAEAPTILFIPALLIIDGIVFAIVRRRRTWPGRALA